MEFTLNYPLSEITTFHIGGKADYFVSVKNPIELDEALRQAMEKSLPVLVLGRGSNVLASDDGFRGLVIQNQIKGITLNADNSLKVGAGEYWDDVVTFAISKNLGGIECLSAVPGSAGGAAVQNIGAYGQTLGDLVTEVVAIEISSGKEKVFTASECEFGYRTSWFKKNPNKYVVTEFTIRLNPQAPANTSYAHVAKHFEGKPHPTLGEVREFIIRLRASKGYLIMLGYESYNTAGSFFKNPVVSEDVYTPLREVLGSPDLNRFWPMKDGVKIAAAFLMQEAGFGKGYREGAVGISPKHSLSLVNFGGATSQDVKNLAEKIKETVYKKFGIRLEEEVLYV